jgi:hypothetical protein
MTAVRGGRPLLARVLLVLAAAALALLSSCGGADIPPPGTPVVSFTSTNTKFTSYVIAIDSITLTSSTGVFATPLVTPETVDLTRLTDISELVEAPAVPSGSYTSATLTLDYTLADITVLNNGESVGMSVALPGGAGVFTSVVTITFDPAHPLVITNAESTRMAVNFDLDAFNSVDLSTSIVTVNPFVTISQPPLDATPLRSRGLFVYTQDTAFVMNTRPFFDLVSALGAVTVNVTPTTYYNINGQTFTGSAGLAAMKTLPIDTAVAAYGTLASLEGITPAFNATTVLVGTSLEAEGLNDHILGVVGARDGDTLTVIGGDYLYGSGVSAVYTVGGVYYLPTSTVQLGAATIISRDGYNVSGLTPQSISVGQQIDVGGYSTVDPITGAVVLDASAGQVRITNTRAWGVVNSAAPNDVNVSLLSLGGFSPDSFKFAGTNTGGGAADPNGYLITTTPIDLDGTKPDTLVAFDGVVNPFGSAPPMFTASAVTKAADTQQTLVVEWVNGGAAAPFTTQTANGLIIDLANANLGTLHQINYGPASTDLKELPASPLITSVGANPNDLVLAVGNNTLTTGISIFQTASAFSSALTSTFNGTNKIFRLVAVGQYNSASNTFVAAHIDVSLEQ